MSNIEIKIKLDKVVDIELFIQQFVLLFLIINEIFCNAAIEKVEIVNMTICAQECKASECIKELLEFTFTLRIVK